MGSACIPPLQQGLKKCPLVILKVVPPLQLALEDADRQSPVEEYDVPNPTFALWGWPETLHGVPSDLAGSSQSAMIAFVAPKAPWTTLAAISGSGSNFFLPGLAK